MTPLNFAPPFGGILRSLQKAPAGYFVEVPPVGYIGPFKSESEAVERLNAHPAPDKCAVLWWRGKPS